MDSLAFFEILKDSLAFFEILRDSLRIFWNSLKLFEVL